MSRPKLAIGAGYLLVLLFYLWAVRAEFAHIDRANMALAHERGSVLFRLVEQMRDWNAQHGGVYVPLTATTAPNPYLTHPLRDIQTVDGRALTMVNPAYMTRQIAEIAEKANGVRFHITSLKPLRPQNAPDPWEVQTLQRLQSRSVTDVLELVPGNSGQEYRYMAALLVKPACMMCHAQQGYQVGDVRGGISVSMPAQSQLEIAATQKTRVLWSYGIAAALIAMLLHFVVWKTMRHIHRLQQMADEQEHLVEVRTANLLESNRQLANEIAERERAEARLKIAGAAVENSHEGIMVTDAENRIIDINPAFTAITGYTAQDVLGRSPQVLSSGRHDADFYRDMWAALEERGRWSGEIWNRKKGGELYPQWLSISVIGSGGSPGCEGRYVATLSDITQRKAVEVMLKQQAQTDHLTGLPNRVLFMDRLSMACLSANRYQELFAVIYADLDNFKSVNDAFGHAAGDELLVEAARRMAGCVRDSDTVARLGGDEFAIVLPKLSSQQEGEDIVARLVGALAQPFALHAGEGRVSCSAGVAFYPTHGHDIDTLLNAADQALYRVKRTGRNGYRLADPPDGVAS